MGILVGGLLLTLMTLNAVGCFAVGVWAGLKASGGLFGSEAIYIFTALGTTGLLGTLSAYLWSLVL